MTLKPQPLSPHSMQRSFGRKGKAQPHMVIDLKHESQWSAVHEQGVNGVAWRRRPIRAIESYLDGIAGHMTPQSLVVMQSQLRRSMRQILETAGEAAEDSRGQFLLNDLAAQMRVMIGQSQSRNFAVQINQGLDQPLMVAPSGLVMVLAYRDVAIDFSQAAQNGDDKIKDLKTLQSYGTLLARGAAYDPPVYWRLKTTGDHPFCLVITPTGARKTARR